jgi:hypothetical protein
MFRLKATGRTTEAGTVPEKITISHRGARYEIGRGKRYYGIWVSGAPDSPPVDRWPETRDGWAQAWARFATIETPGTIVAAEPATTAGNGGAAATRRIAAFALLTLGIVGGLIGLFPGYFGTQSLTAHADQLVPHIFYLVGWAASAAAIFVNRRGAARFGALFGTGLSAVAFGMFLSDLGQVISSDSSLLGAGLVLSLLGWLGCAAGSALGLTIRGTGPRQAAAVPRPPWTGTAGRPVRPRPAQAGPVALLVLAAIGTVAAFVPSWDSITLASSTGSAQTITAGNAFSNPGAVIAGNVVVMAALILVAGAAALWRPARNGAVLLAGAIAVMIAQAISALVQVSEPASPQQFGISPAQASQLGLTITSGVTPVFWVYCVFVISLIICCAWLLTSPPSVAMPATPWAPGPGSLPSRQGKSGNSGETHGDSDETHGDSDTARGDSDRGDNQGGEGDGNGKGDEETTFA